MKLSCTKVTVILILNILLVYWVLFLLFLHQDHPARDALATDTYKEMKILYCIASASAGRIDVMEMLLDKSLDWCEAGYHVLVIVDTYDTKYEKVLAEYPRSCISASFQINVHLHERSINLVTAHRQHFNMRIGDFDVFVYGEDDMLIPLSTLARWRHETLQLPNPEKQMIGLLRYENALKELRSNGKKIKKLSPEFSYFAATSDIDRLSMRSRVCWEPNPQNYTVVSKGGKGKLYITNMPGTS